MNNYKEKQLGLTQIYPGIILGFLFRIRWWSFILIFFEKKIENLERSCMVGVVSLLYE